MRAQGVLQKRQIVKGRALSDRVDLIFQSYELIRDERALGGRERIVTGLNRELLHTLKDRGDFGQGTLSGLHHRNSIVGIAQALV